MRALSQAVRLDRVDVADAWAICDQIDSYWLAADHFLRRQPLLHSGQANLANEEESDLG